MDITYDRDTWTLHLAHIDVRRVQNIDYVVFPREVWDQRVMADDVPICAMEVTIGAQRYRVLAERVLASRLEGPTLVGVPMEEFLQIPEEPFSIEGFLFLGAPGGSRDADAQRAQDIAGLVGARHTRVKTGWDIVAEIQGNAPGAKASGLWPWWTRRVVEYRDPVVIAYDPESAVPVGEYMGMKLGRATLRAVEERVRGGLRTFAHTSPHTRLPLTRVVRIESTSANGTVAVVAIRSAP